MYERPFVRSAYNYDKDLASFASGVVCDDEPIVQQHFADEVDINTLVRRFHLSGEMPEGVRAVTYGDFTGISDFHTAANAIAVARENFEAMPAEVRRRFDNDPQRFVAFCSDESNLDELRRMGLAVPKAVLEAPAPVVDVGAPASSASSASGAPAVIPAP